VLDSGFCGQEGIGRDADDSGFGMVIVDQLARRWGTAREGGYRVWAELGLPGSRVELVKGCSRTPARVRRRRI
jgi:hypothetical protein